MILMTVRPFGFRDSGKGLPNRLKWPEFIIHYKGNMSPAERSSDAPNSPTENSGSAQDGNGAADNTLEYWTEPIASPRFNYWVSALEGALFAGGLGFINASTILPKMVETLGGPVWLISLMPVLGQVGFLLPPILMAHRIERMHRFKPYVWTCCLLQRLAYGFAAVSLLIMTGHPQVALAAVAIAPLLSGIFGGFGLVAWQRLFTKCIPREKRHSLFAMRSTIACIIGIAAGYVIEMVLGRWPDVLGYGILHGLAFTVLMISFCVFSLTREPAERRPAPAQTDLLTNLNSMPGLILADRHFVLLLLAKFFRNGAFIIAPFLAIQCLHVLDRPKSFLGVLVIVQMVGSILGNALAGTVGGKLGAKYTMLGALGAFGCMSLWAISATNMWEWIAIFVLFGAGTSMSEIANSALGLEMGRHDKRSTFLAVSALANLPGMLIAAGMSRLLYQHFWLQAVATVVCVLIAAVFLIPLRERHDGPHFPQQAEPG